MVAYSQLSTGFTAWSSTRDPAQVFELLEQVFKSFDAITTRRRVFKVETVGGRLSHVSKIIHRVILQRLVSRFTIFPLIYIAYE